MLCAHTFCVIRYTIYNFLKDRFTVIICGQGSWGGGGGGGVIPRTGTITESIINLLNHCGSVVVNKQLSSLPFDPSLHRCHQC